MLSRWMVRFAAITTLCLAVCATASAQYGGGGETGGSGGTGGYTAPPGGYSSGKAIGIGVGAAAGAAVGIGRNQSNKREGQSNLLDDVRWQIS